MAGERIRSLQVERPSSGQSVEDTRLLDAIERSVRKLLPEWLRGSQLVRDVSFSSGVTAYVQHRLGRAHKGWLLARVRTVNANLFEIDSGHADWSAARIATHVQLRAGATFIADLVVW
jgi:hypothetical protein